MKVLEDKLPGLSAKLPAHYQKAIDADGLKNSSPTEQNLQERLAHLEHAMAILLKAQVRCEQSRAVGLHVYAAHCGSCRLIAFPAQSY